MISEDENERFVESLKCRECTDWHHHCKSECCKIIYINVNPEKMNGAGKLLTIRPDKPLSLNDQRYFGMRDAQCIRGLVRFKKDRIRVIGNQLIYLYPCKHLQEDNLCGVHSKCKPEICQALTLETAKLPGQAFKLTPNCLFKYKCKEVK